MKDTPGKGMCWKGFKYLVSHNNVYGGYIKSLFEEIELDFQAATSENTWTMGYHENIFQKAGNMLRFRFFEKLKETLRGNVKT